MQVIDRTRVVKPVKGRQPLRYEVVIYSTEFDWEQGTGWVIAKFVHAGDAYAWASALKEPCHVVVVRN